MDYLVKKLLFTAFKTMEIVDVIWRQLILKNAKTIQFCLASSKEKFSALRLFFYWARGYKLVFRRQHVKLANVANRTRDLFFRRIHGRLSLNLFSLIGRHPDLRSILPLLVKKCDVKKCIVNWSHFMTAVFQ